MLNAYSDQDKLYVHYGARIFHIFCMEDMFQLPEQIDYVRDEDHSYRIDFEKALKDGIDAIELHLSEEKPCEFDKQLRISMPYWDCDRIFIMNPEIIDTRLGFLKDFLKG